MSDFVTPYSKAIIYPGPGSISQQKSLTNDYQQHSANLWGEWNEYRYKFPSFIFEQFWVKDSASTTLQNV